ncbi:MAG: hypothetical protein IJ772_04905 [Bacilli bacterium]|nr:hypothetical protein [Bacilli bacterium]
MNKDKKEEEITLTKEQLQKRNETIADFISFIVKKNDYEEKENGFTIENGVVVFKDFESMYGVVTEFCGKLSGGKDVITFGDAVILDFVSIFNKDEKHTKFVITDTVRKNFKTDEYFDSNNPIQFALKEIEPIIKFSSLDSNNIEEKMIEGYEEKEGKENIKFLKHIFKEGVDFEYTENEFLKIEKEEKKNKNKMGNATMLLLAGYSPVEALTMSDKLDTQDALFMSLMKSSSNPSSNKEKKEETSKPEGKKISDIIDSSSTNNSNFDEWFKEPFKKIERSNDEIVDWITRGLTLKNEFEKKFGKAIQSEIQKLR